MKKREVKFVQRPSGVRFNRYCVYRVRQSRQLPLGLGLGAPSLYAAVLARVSAAFNGPLARAVVFGVHIDGSPSFFVCSQDGSAVLVSHTQWPRDFSGHLIVEGLLIAVIVFQLSTKSYKPLKKPLTEKEIDELCDEWEPELLCPPIKEGAKIDAPTLESAVGPHTIVDC
ncbi:long chain base biosynthesis protein 1b [Zea mays]|nr:long chain base biosynthesis protein 1b [Zea mays]|eukprot:XP_020408065.1 long chain base biosynthesis protein 1b [Zea mays]